LLAHPAFESSERLSQLLRYLVERGYEGSSGDLKEYTIGVEVFEREASFDPRQDSVVRVTATRLRAKLETYYAEDGKNDPVVIELPRGGYCLIPRRRAACVPQVTSPAKLPLRKYAFSFIALLFLGIPVLLHYLRPRFDFSTPRSFFALPGEKKTPAFSPDGEFIAFEWKPEGQGNSDLYVQRLGEDMPTQLTHTPADEEIGAAWNPNGKQIAFFRKSRETARLSIVTMPAQGGPEEVLGDVDYMPSSLSIATLDWTPDGRFLVTADKRSPTAPLSVVLISIKTRQKFWLTDPPSATYGDGPVAVSPNGHYLAFRRRVSASLDDICIMPLPDPEATSGLTAEKSVRRLTRDLRDIYGLTWELGSRALVISSSRDGSRPSLYRVSLDGAEVTRIPESGLDAKMPSMARNMRRLAWIAETTNTNLWQLATIPGSVPTRLIAASGINTEPQYSPDGLYISFRSNRSGNDEIWIANRDGSNLRRLSNFHGPLTGSPRWSPDGKQLIFETRVGDKGVLCFVRPGLSPNCIDDPDGTAGVPSWSHDGHWLYFGSSRTGTVQVWKRPANGGQPVQLTHNGGFAPFESPDHRLVYYSRGITGHGLWSIPLDGGNETAVLPDLPTNMWGNWALFQDRIYSIAPQAEGSYWIFCYNFKTGENLPWAPLMGSPVLWDSGLAVSPDGKWLLYSSVEYKDSEIMLLE
jgi:Tol biopolymer transport system component